MSSSEGPKRKYNSSRRASQARQTRRQIIEAARRLFFETGYSATTIDAIAREAGVAPETIYAGFGSKPAILRELLNFSLVGDDSPVPLLQRDYIQSAKDETDQHRLVESFAENISQIMTRVSPIFALMRATAASDPEVAALQARVLKNRTEGIGFFVQQLQRIGPLRAGLTLERAAVTAWALSSSEVFILMTAGQGWTREQYVSWLADVLERVLLP